MARALASLVLAAVIAGCGDAPAPAVAKHPVSVVAAAGQTASVATPPPAGTPWTYEVKAAPRGASLRIEGHFPPGTPASFEVGEGGERFVSDVAVVAGGPRTAVTGERGVWSIPACAAGCVVTYTFALRAAGTASAERSVAEVRGDVVESPPSVWLLRPAEAPAGSPFRFHVTSPPGEAFATGVFAVAGAADTYEGRTVEPFDLPYAAFGPMRRVQYAKGQLEVAYLSPGPFKDEAAVATWLERSADVVAAYYGRPPVPRLLVLLRSTGGSRIGFGSTMGMSGAAIDMQIGQDITAATMKDDWVLVHEMIHTALPDVTRQHHWLEEGLATYVESLARSRAGLVTAERVWRDWMDGMPKGQPAAGDQGLDRTHTWGRTYWGGALFCFAADIEIRTRTDNKRSLDDALRAVLAEGGNIAVSWPVERVLEVGDRATGVPVLRELYDRMAPRAEKVDLDAMWKKLGIARQGDKLVFDDQAPLAKLRLAMTAPPAPR
jgi:hypothetical protein